MDLLDVFEERKRLRDTLTELFQETIATLQNVLDEFLPVNVWNNFHGGQPRTGTGDVRA
jgi:hypothetical protein